MNRNNPFRVAILGVTMMLLTVSVTAQAAAPGGAGYAPADDPVARGRYLAVVGGCNDCHTPGYMEASGDVPEAQWFTGSAVGFQGPWGTTYAPNLRLTADGMTETAWLARARTTMLPPMPWFNLRQMSDADLRALYAYLQRLGPAGQPAPAHRAPGESVATPYIEFVPKQPLAHR